AMVFDGGDAELSHLDEKAGEPRVRADIPPKPTEETGWKGFRPAVGWLLSGQLISGLRKIVLSSMFKRDLDVRDWMTGRVLVRLHRRHRRRPEGRLQRRLSLYS